MLHYNAMEERRPRREERREETRRELIAAALTVFAREGFHGATLDQIAREAGYTTGAIYWHFKNKDELFLAAFDEYAIARVRELTEVDQGAVGGLPERTRALADQWMARQAADPSFLVIALEFLIHAWHNPHLLEAIATRHAAVRLAVTRLIDQEARAAGVDLPMPAEDVATALREMGVGLALVKLTDRDAFSDRLYGDFVQLFFEMAISNQASGPRLDHSRGRRPSRRITAQGE
jgi:AcrR family transcriptional regulator